MIECVLFNGETGEMIKFYRKGQGRTRLFSFDGIAWERTKGAAYLKADKSLITKA